MSNTLRYEYPNRHSLLNNKNDDEKRKALHLKPVIDIGIY